MENTRRAVVLGSLGVAAASLTGSASAAGGSLRDQAAIRAVVDGIDDAVDDKDWARARAYFTDQVDVDFEALEGGPPARVSADVLIDGWRRNLYAEKLSFHQRSNHAIVLLGDRAVVRSKGYAFNRLQRRLGDALWEVWGIYTHRLVRVGGGDGGGGDGGGGDGGGGDGGGSDGGGGGGGGGWRCSAIGLTTVLHARGNELARTFVPEG